MRLSLPVCAALLALLMPVSAASDEIATLAGKVSVQPVVTGLSEPWSVGFLPDGALLITERGGRLLMVRDGSVSSISGLPEVQTGGQGGLLDILVPADFASSQQILFTYARRAGGQTVTAVGAGRLDADANRLDDSRVLFTMTSPSAGGRHFGSRLVEAPDGRIFVTLGERGDMDEAQDLGSHNGTVIRLNRDGTVPVDNPFVGQTGALPEIWSYGHRNPQGAALDLGGQLWVNEHGARGGDEVNMVRRGANYGWPVISYGTHYSGFRIGEGTQKPGMEQPAFYWDPSIAPSGLMIYSGKLWPEWRGDMFTGSLKFDYLSRLDPDDGWSEERIKGSSTARVRDVRAGPDGSIWFLSVDNGTLYRMTPAT